VVVLGETGRNFAAGMSGGIAYVYDVKGKFGVNCNKEMVDLDACDVNDKNELFTMLQKHYEYTGSTIAKFILEDLNNQVKSFVKVFPKDYKKALQKPLSPPRRRNLGRRILSSFDTVLYMLRVEHG
jgi:glutamate synthase (NADPH/NADH) large chain